MADLITAARAKYAIPQTAFTSADNTTIDALVDAVSEAIQKLCDREFGSATFDELYDGAGDDRLVVQEYPILSVARVAGNPVAVLTVTNTSSANQRATVAVTATGLTLVRVASGVTTTVTSVTWAGNVTLNAVAAAVNALGAGWSATVPDSSHGLRASADLRAVQGAVNALNVDAGLLLHVEELSDYEVDADRGWLLRRTGWARGRRNYRVVYTAGYSTVPQPVQEAAAQWVAGLFLQSKRDPGIQQQSVPGLVAYSVFSGVVPPQVKALLAPYRKVRV